MEATTNTPEVKLPAVKDLPQAFVALQAAYEVLRTEFAALKAKVDGKSAASTREMTDDDARRILTGDLATKKHKDAAEALGLSYGQVYSCRLEFTFKNIHKEMKDAGKKNPWSK